MLIDIPNKAVEDFAWPSGREIETGMPDLRVWVTSHGTLDAVAYAAGTQLFCTPSVEQQADRLARFLGIRITSIKYWRGELRMQTSEGILRGVCGTSASYMYSFAGTFGRRKVLWFWQEGARLRDGTIVYTMKE